MRLHFMVVRRVPPVPSPVLRDVYTLLERRGFAVSDSIAEEVLTRCDELEPDHDLYVLKSHTELALSLAGILHGRGARLLNPYLSCSVVQNKLLVSRRLRDAGVPAPRGWATADPRLLAEIVETTPLILKPYRGHRGAGIRLARDPGELAAVGALDDATIVQELVPGRGEDLKVYVVGEEVFTVRKPFSPTSFTRPGRPCPVPAAVRDLALRTGRALGLGLYGLDVIESPSGPVVVDVNYFPGYKGVADVAPRIADYIAGFARGRHGLAAPEPATPVRV